MQITSSLVSLLFSSSSSSSTTSADDILSIVTGTATDIASTAPQLDPLTVLAGAEKNSAAAIIAKSNEPQTQREIADFVKAVNSATSVDQLLADPKVTKVLLAANGLEDYANYPGLVSKALQSDPTDTTSLANQLSTTNASWLSSAKTYQFFSKGLQVIQDPATIQTITDGYAEARYREGLDANAPGVSAALSFKDLASTLTTPLQILGNGVAREVVTGALGLPAEIAYQSLDAQAKAITDRMDVKQLQDPNYVEALMKRYLINKNSSSSGLTV